MTLELELRGLLMEWSTGFLPAMLVLLDTLISRQKTINDALQAHNLHPLSITKVVYVHVAIGAIFSHHSSCVRNELVKNIRFSISLSYVLRYHIYVDSDLELILCV